MAETLSDSEHPWLTHTRAQLFFSLQNTRGSSESQWPVRRGTRPTRTFGENTLPERERERERWTFWVGAARRVSTGAVARMARDAGAAAARARRLPRLWTTRRLARVARATRPARVLFATRGVGTGLGAVRSAAVSVRASVPTHGISNENSAVWCLRMAGDEYIEAL